MFLDSNGMVGIGTSSPGAKLEIATTYPHLRLRSTENGSDAAAPWISFGYGSGAWNGLGSIGYISTGHSMLYIRNDSGSHVRIKTNHGDVDIGVQDAYNRASFATWQPSFYFNKTIYSASDRKLKENIRPASEADVLKKFEALPISCWNFKKEKKKRDHVGPMAQDFKKIIGLGATDDSICLNDQIGVTMVAVKGLIKENKALKNQAAKFKEQGKALKTKVDTLETQLAALAKRLEKLEGQGE